MDNTTVIFEKDILLDANTKEVLKSVCEDLKERGYDPIKQIAGYLISGDPGYISSYKECRSRIQKLDRNSIIELMLTSYIK